MHLAQLIADLTAPAVRGPLDIDITRVDYDSRQVRAGSLFCCLPGAARDGHDFAATAVAGGAVAVLVERALDLPMTVTQVQVANARAAMAAAAAALWSHPSESLDVIGVTGTNGKTTTTFLLHAVVEHAGRRGAVRGTLSGTRTTPEAPDLQAWLAEQRDAGIDTVAMEVSSHALDLHRVDATRFAVAVFTNLSTDHLDHHGTMEAYFSAKARLFTPERSRQAVINLDDPYGRRLAEQTTLPVVGYSVSDAEDLAVGAASCTFGWRGHTVRLTLGGRFNVANALAAAEAARLLGLDDATIAEGLSRPIVVPGRFEAVDEGQPFRVLVDYAHTPDALERVLAAAREVAGGARVHVVFGCGGNRDRSKRPLMGVAAARGADRTVITADNSRDEPTAAIIEAVRNGYETEVEAMAGVPRELVVEPDRDAAIAAALTGAAPGDVVIIAGKGHETTQAIGATVTSFVDRDVVRRHLHAAGYRGAAAAGGVR